MLIDGKLAAEKLRAQLSKEVEQLRDEKGIVPKLAVILVGEDSASHIYVRNKVKQCQEVGMISTEIRLSASITESELLACLGQLNDDDLVHGILVQLPLPEHINEGNVTEAIAPHKDVDGFHALNSGRLLNGEQGALLPCTPQGCLLLIKQHLGHDLAGKHAVVIGRSNIVGKPLAILLLQAHCTVSIVHSRTKNLPDICRQADILVAAVGIPKFVQADWIKEGATVIDVGINRIIDNNSKHTLVGDVDYSNVLKVCGGITPVPGGVGPMTIACLLKNTLEATQTFANSAALSPA